jgi:hypothetical protein
VRITQVDDDGRLFLIEDILTKEQVTNIESIDWLSLPWNRGLYQEKWDRRHIQSWVDPISYLNDYIVDKISIINQEVGTSFPPCFGSWWLDEPEFCVDIHTDGELRQSMQLYFIAPDDSFGTVFYHYKNQSSVKYKFLSIPNTGYIMKNHLNEDGSQPLMWHGMSNRVPPNTIRLSNYNTGLI